MSCSENWSEESDHDDDEQEESSGGGGSKVRCYECTFCKRGFTNAQALGGHMNIHRKDRAKAKQITPPKPTSSTSNSNSNKLLLSISNNNNNTNTTEEYSLLPSPFVSAQYQQYYSILESHTNYNMYFHHPSPTAPNPRNPPPPPMPMKQPQQELLGPNLSLQIGPTTHLHRTPPIHNDAAELDLELRLGHHHPY